MKIRDANLKNSSRHQEGKPKTVVNNQPSGDDKISSAASIPSPPPPPPSFVESGISDDDVDKCPDEIASDERRKGNAYYSRGDFDQAIKCYSTCLRYDARCAVAYSNRGENQSEPRCCVGALYLVSCLPSTADYIHGTHSLRFSLLISMIFAHLRSNGPSKEEGLDQGRR